MPKLLHEDLTARIIKCCFSIYNELGYGYPEKVYQSALTIDFNKAGIKFQKESYSKILYDGKIVGRFYLDFLVEDKIALELKVRREMYDTDWIQLLNYLKAKNLQVGILVVFTNKTVLIKRVANQR